MRIKAGFSFCQAELRRSMNWFHHVTCVKKNFYQNQLRTAKINCDFGYFNYTRKNYASVQHKIISWTTFQIKFFYNFETKKLKTLISHETLYFRPFLQQKFAENIRQNYVWRERWYPQGTGIAFNSLRWEEQQLKKNSVILMFSLLFQLLSSLFWC